MALSLHTLHPVKGSRTKKFRVGRGLGSGRGKTAGRGTKGQRARTGGRKRLRLKGLKQMLLAFPKTRGFQSLNQKTVAISLIQLATLEPNTVVTLALLKEKGLIPRRAMSVKIIGGGECGKAFTIKGIQASAAAKTAIEKAGGQFKELSSDPSKK